MAVTPASSPLVAVATAVAGVGGTGGGGGGEGGGIVHQGTLLNVVKNIFHDQGMYDVILQTLIIKSYIFTFTFCLFYFFKFKFI